MRRSGLVLCIYASDRTYFMPARRRHNIFNCALVRSSVRSFVYYETCERHVLKMNKPILMPLGTSGPRGKGVNTINGRGEVEENRFGGLAEASFWIIIIIIITTAMFMVLSSWQSHCESSPGSFDECRMAPSGRRPKTKPDDLGCESACKGCQKLHPPSPFIIITQPES